MIWNFDIIYESPPESCRLMGEKFTVYDNSCNHFLFFSLAEVDNIHAIEVVHLFLLIPDIETKNPRPTYGA